MVQFDRLDRFTIGLCVRRIMAVEVGQMGVLH
jgi:hypothetical protein